MENPLPGPIGPSTSRPGPVLAGLLAASLVLALRGEIGYLLYLPTLGLILAWSLVVGAAGSWLDGAGEAPGASDLDRVRAVWLPPLLGTMVLSTLLLGVLALPGQLGAHDAWPRWLGLAPEEVAPLVLAAFSMHAGLALWLAGRAAAGLFARGLSGRAPVHDGMAGRALLLLGAATLGLLLAVGYAPGGRLAHLRAWFRLKSGDPDSSLAELDKLLAAAPDDGLADSALYRMARLWQDELGAPGAADSAFRRLLASYPGSAWADDACLHLAELRLAEGDADEALALALDLPRRFPGSSRIGPAALLAARIHRLAGRSEAAASLLEGLLAAPGAVRLGSRYPRILVPVATLAREELARLGRPGPGV